MFWSRWVTSGTLRMSTTFTTPPSRSTCSALLSLLSLLSLSSLTLSLCLLPLSPSSSHFNTHHTTAIAATTATLSNVALQSQQLDEPRAMAHQHCPRLQVEVLLAAVVIPRRDDEARLLGRRALPRRGARLLLSSLLLVCKADDMVDDFAECSFPGLSGGGRGKEGQRCEWRAPSSCVGRSAATGVRACRCRVPWLCSAEQSRAVQSSVEQCRAEQSRAQQSKGTFSRENSNFLSLSLSLSSRLVSLSLSLASSRLD